METIRIDYESLKNEIASLARKDLSTISSGSLRLFSVDVESVVRSHVSKYSESIYQIGSSSLDGIALDNFLNLETGYLIQMTNWITNSEFHFPKIEAFEEVEVQAEKERVKETKSNIEHKKNTRDKEDFDNMSVIELFVDGLTSIFVRIPLRLADKFAELFNPSSRSSKSSNTNPDSHTSQRTRRIREYSSAYISEVTRVGLDWARSAENFSNNIISQY